MGRTIHGHVYRQEQASPTAMEPNKPMSVSERKRRRTTLILTVTTLLLLLATVALTTIAMGIFEDTGLFQGSSVFGPGVSLVSSQVRPSLLTLLLPLVMAVYQIIWIVYTMTTMCQTSARHHNYYVAPCLHIGIFIPYIVALILLVAWLFTADRGRADVALFLDFAICVSFFTSVVFALRGVESQGLYLHLAAHHYRLNLIRGIVINGVTMAAAVFTMATLQSLGSVLQQYEGAPEGTADTLVLGITGAIFLVWVALDMIVLETYLRYVFSPYFVLLSSLVGIVVRIYNPWDRNTIFALALIGFVALGTVVKVILSGLRIYKFVDPVLIRENGTPSNPGSGPGFSSSNGKIQVGSSRNDQGHSSPDQMVPHNAPSTSVVAGGVYSLPASVVPCRLHPMSLLGTTFSSSIPAGPYGTPYGAPPSGSHPTYANDVTSRRYVVDSNCVAGTCPCSEANDVTKIRH